MITRREWEESFALFYLPADNRERWTTDLVTRDPRTNECSGVWTFDHYVNRALARRFDKAKARNNL